MYIVANTEDGDTLFWSYTHWTEDFSDAESFGLMSGHFKIGELEVDYIDDSDNYNYHGSRITSIRALE